MTLAAAIDVLDRKSEPPPLAPPESEVVEKPAKDDKPPPAKGVVFKVPKSPRPRGNRAARRGSRLKMAAFVTGALVLFAASALYLSVNWEAIVSGGALGRSNGSAAAVLPDSLPASAPELSEIRYYNGERLYALGRYREALVELRRVDRDSRVVSEARSLILRIEDRLLRGPTETGQELNAAR